MPHASFTHTGLFWRSLQSSARERHKMQMCSAHWMCTRRGISHIEIYIFRNYSHVDRAPVFNRLMKMQTKPVFSPVRVESSPSGGKSVNYYWASLPVWISVLTNEKGRCRKDTFRANPFHRCRRESALINITKGLQRMLLINISCVCVVVDLQIYRWDSNQPLTDSMGVFHLKITEVISDISQNRVISNQIWASSVPPLPVSDGCFAEGGSGGARPINSDHVAERGGRKCQ